MAHTLHPGVPNVYRRNRREDEDPALRLVRTDIAGFLGYAERGPLPDAATGESGVRRLTSWAEFVAQYGGFIRAGTLAYAVRAFFENRGEVCYVARVAALGAWTLDPPAKARWEGAGGLALTAKSEGTWGNTIKATFTALDSDDAKGSAHFALRLVRERSAGQAGPPETEFYPRLSLDQQSEDYAPPRLEAFSNLVSLEVPASGRAAFPEESVKLADGCDGLSGVTTADFVGGSDDLRGLRLFEEITEIAILCAPDAVLALPPAEEPPKPPPLPCQPPPPPPAKPAANDDPPAFDDVQVQLIQRAMLDQCERLRDRVAVLDFPNAMRRPQELHEWRSAFRSPFGALYFPWLKVPDALALAGPLREVPPCGHVAGISARIDRSIGGIRHRPRRGRGRRLPAGAESAGHQRDPILCRPRFAGLGRALGGGRWPGGMAFHPHAAVHVDARGIDREIDEMGGLRNQ